MRKGVIRVKKESLLYMLFYWIVFLTMVIFGVYCNSSPIYINTLGIISIFLSAYITYLFRNNTSLCICFFFITYSIYSIFVGVYICPELRIAYFYRQISDELTYVKGMQCVFVFVFTLFVLIINKRTICESFNNSNNSSKTDLKPNHLISIVCIIAIIAVTSTVTLSTYDKRIGITAIFEYRIIFYIIGMLYSRNSKYWKYIWFAMVIVGSVFSFIGGSRADAIPLLIIYVFFYHNRMRIKYLFPMIVTVVFAMISVGAFRQTILRGGFDFSFIIGRIKNEKFTFDTAYAAYIPSLGTIDIAKDINIGEKTRLFFGQFAYVFGGSKYQNYLLYNYILNQGLFRHIGGTVSPTYFYFWFGLLGPAILSLLVYMYIRLLIIPYREKKGVEWHSDIRTAIFGYFVSTVARWFLYGPYPLIRGQLLMLIMMFIVALLDSITCKKFMRKII